MNILPARSATRKTLLRVTIALILVSIEGFFLATNAEKSQGLSKITFDLSTIDASGLSGTGTGKRSIAYEFCIPATVEAVGTVLAIDPSLKVYRNSRGRIGCQKNQYLCIGETHQERWREKLLNLANLTYIKKIQQFHAE